jgi:SAM-dependent methyltransferase
MYEELPFPSREKGHVEVARQIIAGLEAHGFARPRGRWLDLGCGTGELLVAFAERFGEISFTGVDFSKASLTRAEEHAKKKGVSNIEFRWGDFRSPDWCDASWDLVTALGTLHHLPDLKAAYVDVARALRPAGCFVLYHYGTYGRFNRVLDSQLVASLVPDPQAIGERVAIARKLFDLRNPDGGPLEDAWVADQYCNPCESTQTMVEVHDLLTNAGLEPLEWIGLSEAPADCFSDAELQGRYAELPRRERLRVLDLRFRKHDNLVLARRRLEA